MGPDAVKAQGAAALDSGAPLRCRLRMATFSSPQAYETKNYIDVSLVSADLAPDDVQVHICDGTETISQLFSFDVELVSLKGDLDVDALPGTPASLVFSRAAPANGRKFFDR